MRRAEAQALLLGTGGGAASPEELARAREARVEAAAAYQAYVGRVGSCGQLARVERRAAERGAVPRPRCTACGHQGRNVHRLPEPEWAHLQLCPPCAADWRARVPRERHTCATCGVQYHGRHSEGACVRERAARDRLGRERLGRERPGGGP